MNSLGKAECRRSKLLGEIFKGINSRQPGCGMCLYPSACQLLQKLSSATRASVWQQHESLKSLLLPSVPAGATKGFVMTAKAAGSGLSQIRPFFCERHLMLAQEITEKQIAGGWESCPAWFCVPVEAQTVMSKGLPCASPSERRPSFKVQWERLGQSP